MNNDEIMTVEEVAKLLKLKPQTVYKWAQEGQIPAAKLGKEWRFRRSILDEWIDASIALSKGGFDLMYLQTAREVRQKGLTRDDINRIIGEATAGRHA